MEVAGAAGRAGSGRVRLELITQSTHSKKVAGILGVGLEFLAEPGHVDVDGTGDGDELESPHLAEEFFAGDDLTFVLEQEAEQLELACRQGDGFAVDGHDARAEVDLDVTKPDQLGLRGGGGSHAGAAQKGFDAGDQFHELEGFGEVVVGA